MKDVKQLTAQMVAMNTISAGSNMALAKFIEVILAEMGFQTMLQEKTYPGGILKANLIARIGPKDVEPFMLSGHMDTMPVGDPKKWRKDPFGLFETQGNLYGLGAVDMKGPLSASICAVESLVQNSAKLRRELILGLTYDEEAGLRGARRLVDAQIVKPRFILVAEPTMLVPMRMHKGHICLRVTCRGLKGHSAKPNEGINAIELAADVIAEIKEFGKELMGARQPCIDPSYATLNISSIDSADNTIDPLKPIKAKANEIPWICTIDFAIRPIPGQSIKWIQDDITQRLVAIQRYIVLLDEKKIGSSDEKKIKISSSIAIDLQEKTKLPTEPMYTAAESELVKVAEAVSGKKAMGAHYSTDASVLQRLGSDCIIFGPGNIGVAHREDEYIEIGQLMAGVEKIREIVQRMCF